MILSRKQEVGRTEKMPFLNTLLMKTHLYSNPKRRPDIATPTATFTMAAQKTAYTPITNTRNPEILPPPVERTPIPT